MPEIFRPRMHSLNGFKDLSRIDLQIIPYSPRDNEA
jgi:hypothetical protein